ncbi:PREDICTED: uncharacterized protein LOC109581243 [Amphimedon queenslandica]|uniref:Uncharacterized protein n=1 Tax=Amphimedon queenslandica TaxID=400682 RepID=A0AAN0J184_AMPQE|nr:PREDICTED: uncharacterized protein LOC109581243 [Amphimedon queenslandica]|eukprot:XP_019850750.1 PREDICTED: uncharacterized protein LOC109581243 [Amphimedon queenslandica]
MEALDLPDDGLEIKIRAQALAKEVDLLVGSKFCWPRNDCILPWCPLVTMDTSGTPPPSTSYMLLYKTEGESIDGIYNKYKDDAHLEALFIVSGDSYEPLASNSLQPHDLSFLISIIPGKFQNKVLSLAHNTKYLEASVTGFFPGFIRGKSRALLPQLPSSYYTLFKALQYVIQNGIVVSLSPNIPGICPADEVLLVHILEAICYLFVEQHVEFTRINLNQLISFVCHPVYFNSLFPKDFIFFFNVANLYWNESTLYNQVSPFMMECLHHLLLIPVEALNCQLRLFVKQGDFHVHSGSLGGTTLFKMTAKSMLSCFKIYYSSQKTAEIIHVFLLLSK